MVDKQTWNLVWVDELMISGGREFQDFTIRLTRKSSLSSFPFCVNSEKMDEKAELACAYSAFILSDYGAEVSAENIGKILKVAKVSVDSLWLNLFAKALKSVDVKELVKSSSAASSSVAVVSAAPTTQAAAPEATKAAKEEKKEESEDEDDGDMGFGLFD